MNEPPWGQDRGRSRRPGAPADFVCTGIWVAVSVGRGEVGAGRGSAACAGSRSARRAGCGRAGRGSAPSERGTVEPRPCGATGQQGVEVLRGPIAARSSALASSRPSPEGTVRARKTPTRARVAQRPGSIGRSARATNSPGMLGEAGTGDVLDPGVDPVAVGLGAGAQRRRESRRSSSRSRRRCSSRGGRSGRRRGRSEPRISASRPPVARRNSSSWKRRSCGDRVADAPPGVVVAAAGDRRDAVGVADDHDARPRRLGRPRAGRTSATCSRSC